VLNLQAFHQKGGESGDETWQRGIGQGGSLLGQGQADRSPQAMPQMKGVKELRLLVQQLKPGRYGNASLAISASYFYLFFVPWRLCVRRLFCFWLKAGR
jgi:hypothetical protein